MASSVRSVPEKTRISDRRPEYWSLVVRITCATRGPSGSQVARGRVSPSRVTISGTVVVFAAWKPFSIQRSSSSVPTSLVVWAGSTGKKRALMIALFSTSYTSATAISSPSR